MDLSPRSNRGYDSGWTTPTPNPGTNSPEIPDPSDNQDLVEAGGEMTADIDDEDSVEETNSEMIVLDPEHPLMVKFQDALNKQLKQKLEILEMDERELDQKVKATQKHRYDMGVVLYEKQQELAKLQNTSEKVTQQLETHTGRRLYREAELNRMRGLYKQVFKDSECAQLQASTLQKELDNISIRKYYLLRSMDDVQSDVKVMVTAAEKAKQVLVKRESEKLKQDYLVDALTQLVDNKKTEIGMLQAQFEAQKKETLRNKELIAEFNVELEALKNEVNGAGELWDGTLMGITRRDESYNIMLNQISETQKLLLTKTREAETFKKNISDSEIKHEKKVELYSKLNRDMATTTTLTEKVKKKTEKLSIDYSNKNRVLKEIEYTLVQSSYSKKDVERQLNLLMKSIEVAVLAKIDMKLELIEILQNQASFVKAAQYTKKTMESTARLTGRLENQLVESENEIVKIENEYISSVNRNEDKMKNLDQIRKEVEERNQICNNYLVSDRKNLIQIERNQHYMDDINKRLVDLTDRADGAEISPLENMMINLQRSLKKEHAGTLEDQTIWIEKQFEFLSLMKRKQEVVDATKYKNHQITIFSGRRSKYDKEIEKCVGEIKSLETGIRHARSDLEKVALLLVEKKGLKSDMENGGYLSETEFIRELREHEDNYYEESQRLQSIVEEKEDLLQRIVMLEKQIGFWERKLQIGIEMKESVGPRQSSNQSERNLMLSEIHRMNVRYQNLRREQEKLIRNMEEVVTRREYIDNSHKARKQREPNLLTRSRCKRELAEAKRQITKFKQLSKEMDEDRKKMTIERRGLGIYLEDRKAKVGALRDEVDQREAEDKYLVLSKLQAMNELVIMNKRRDRYMNVKAGKYKRTTRDSQTLDEELHNESVKQFKLQQILGQLCEDFPEASNDMKRLLITFTSSNPLYATDSSHSTV